MLSFSINKEKIGEVVQKEVYEIIKEELRNKLKVKTTIQFPQTFNNGYLKTEVIYDDEVIHENVQTIKTGSTIFSF